MAMMLFFSGCCVTCASGLRRIDLSLDTTRLPLSVQSGLRAKAGGAVPTATNWLKSHLRGPACEHVDENIFHWRRGRLLLCVDTIWMALKKYFYGFGNAGRTAEIRLALIRSSG
jgi:hypothetical protein